MQFICLKLDSEMYLDLNTSIIMKKLNTLITIIEFMISKSIKHCYLTLGSYDTFRTWCFCSP